MLRGALQVRVGSLLPRANAKPAFAQIYVCDQNEEREAAIRLEHLLRACTNPVLTAGRSGLHGYAHTLLQGLQQEQKACNVLVRDLLNAVERVRQLPAMPQRVRMLFDANRRPAGEHERRYNAQSAPGEAATATAATATAYRQPWQAASGGGRPMALRASGRPPRATRASALRGCSGSALGPRRAAVAVLARAAGEVDWPRLWQAASGQVRSSRALRRVRRSRRSGGAR